MPRKNRARSDPRILAQLLKDAGLTVVAGLTDDIVGNVIAENGKVEGSTSVRIYAVDSVPSLSGELARYVWGLGVVYLPRIRRSRLRRSGSTALGAAAITGPYQRTGSPALRFTERTRELQAAAPPDGQNSRFVNFGYTANIARLNLATVASLAAAPMPPDSARQVRDTLSGGQDWDLKWPAVSRRGLV